MGGVKVRGNVARRRKATGSTHAGESGLPLRSDRELLSMVGWLLPADMSTIARLTQSQLAQTRRVARFLADRSQVKGEALAFFDRAVAPDVLLRAHEAELVRGPAGFDTASASTDKLGSLSLQMARYGAWVGSVQRTVRVLQRSLERHGEGIWLGYPTPTTFESADEFDMVLDLDYYVFQGIGRALDPRMRGRGYPVDCFDPRYLPVLETHKESRDADPERGPRYIVSLDFENLMVPRVRYEVLARGDSPQRSLDTDAWRCGSLVTAVEAPVWILYLPRYAPLLLHETLHGVAYYLINEVADNGARATTQVISDSIVSALETLEQRLLHRYLSIGLIRAFQGRDRKLSRAIVEEVLVDYWTYQIAGWGYLYAVLFVGLASTPIRSPAKELPVPWTARLLALCSWVLAQEKSQEAKAHARAIMGLLQWRRGQNPFAEADPALEFSLSYDNELSDVALGLFNAMDTTRRRSTSSAPPADEPDCFPVSEIFKAYAVKQLQGAGLLTRGDDLEPCYDLTGVPTWLWRLYRKESPKLRDAWDATVEWAHRRNTEAPSGLKPPPSFPEGRFMDFLGLLRGDMGFWKLATLPDDRADGLGRKVVQAYSDLNPGTFGELRFYRFGRACEEQKTLEEQLQEQRPCGWWWTFGRFDFVTLQEPHVAKYPPVSGTRKLDESRTPYYCQRRIVQFLDGGGRRGDAVDPQAIRDTVGELEQGWPVLLLSVVTTYKDKNDGERGWRGRVPLPIIVEGLRGAIRESCDRDPSRPTLLMLSLGYEHAYVLMRANGPETVKLLSQVASVIRTRAAAWLREMGLNKREIDAAGVETSVRVSLLLHGGIGEAGKPIPNHWAERSGDGQVGLMTGIVSRKPLPRGLFSRGPRVDRVYRRLDDRKLLAFFERTGLPTKGEAAELCTYLWNLRHQHPELDYSETTLVKAEPGGDADATTNRSADKRRVGRR